MPRKYTEPMKPNPLGTITKKKPVQNSLTSVERTTGKAPKGVTVALNPDYLSRLKKQELIDMLKKQAQAGKQTRNGARPTKW